MYNILIYPTNTPSEMSHFQLILDEKFNLITNYICDHGTLMEILYKNFFLNSHNTRFNYDIDIVDNVLI